MVGRDVERQGLDETAGKASATTPVRRRTRARKDSQEFARVSSSRHHLRMASADGTGKTTRISLACIACRSRKHKCSGEKPRCAQCTTNNIACEWPTQQKRGPPKQYINSLETRLLETESVLLGLLSTVSSEQLQVAFHHIASSGVAQAPSQYQSENESDGVNSIRPSNLKPSHWSSFPLDSPENVRRWWESRVSDGNRQPLLTGIEEEPVTEYPTEEMSPPTMQPMAQSSYLDDTITSPTPYFPDQAPQPAFVDAPPQHSVPQSDLTSQSALSPNNRHQHSMSQVDSLSQVISDPVEPQVSSSNLGYHQINSPNDMATSITNRNEDGEGVLKISRQFKNDFLW
ncbi:hypothetical protein BU24DRAFT_425535 [Aaosphaeria arxii CBS 175.79]|uniref:Zn(2)-C6 fungal-type domain-containing protein n=1 Tax=Aaosphaeria arxii CBS 175.79 TaxID=1450172 RepID=A0A6A5XJM4_9PLEO|nr:uncharacterized protein BU24DRAFT_425535 [Aaosphaeria arxii CBS 175.79]KAF2012940.1 hypothetical protein BU24DRAFT_425535 [Aaosphaeria arxii CBS 175.79]